MARRVVQDETELVDSVFMGESGGGEQSLDGLPSAGTILYQTGQALAVALGFGLFLGALFQWTGLR